MQDNLERFQVWIYLTAVLLGLATGWQLPQFQVADYLLWCLLGLLLYTTFTQIPLTRLTTLVRDRRFLSALLLGNFMIMPAFVGVGVTLLPDNDALRLGVLLVLLMPCTDWFITFTHLGRGDGARAIAAAPILLVMQLATLPVYLWLFMGQLPAISLEIAGHLVPAFFGLILVPLALAVITRRLAESRPDGQRPLRALGLGPVPLLAAVLFLVTTSQIAIVLDVRQTLWAVAALFASYLVMAALVGKALGWWFRLPAPTGRTLVFSLGTRNSFVVLPLALALPEAWSIAVVVVVLQSLVELLGMIIYLRWVPGWLIRH